MTAGGHSFAVLSCFEQAFPREKPEKTGGVMNSESSRYLS